MSRVKHANRIVGAFSIFILLLLIGVVSVIVMSRSRGETFQFQGKINGSHINGIETGTKVVFLGQEIGKVVRLDYGTDTTSDAEVLNGDAAQENNSHEIEFDENDIILVMECVKQTKDLRVYDQIVPFTPESKRELPRNLRVQIIRNLGGVGEAHLEVALKKSIQGKSNVISIPTRNGETQQVVLIQEQDSLQQQLAEKVQEIAREIGAIEEQIQLFQENSAVTMARARDSLAYATKMIDSIDQAAVQFQKESTETMARSRDTMAIAANDLEKIRASFESAATSIQGVQKEVGTFRTETQTRLANVAEEFKLIRRNTDEVKTASVAALNNSQTAINKVATAVVDSTDRLNKVLDSAQVVTSALAAETRAMPGIMQRTQDTVKGTQEVVEGMRGSFLVRPFVKNPSSSRPVDPSASNR